MRPYFGRTIIICCKCSLVSDAKSTVCFNAGPASDADGSGGEAEAEQGLISEALQPSTASAALFWTLIQASVSMQALLRTQTEAEPEQGLISDAL
jgi:hypothetical protein